MIPGSNTGHDQRADDRAWAQVQTAHDQYVASARERRQVELELGLTLVAAKTVTPSAMWGTRLDQYGIDPRRANRALHAAAKHLGKEPSDMGVRSYEKKPRVTSGASGAESKAPFRLPGDDEPLPPEPEYQPDKIGKSAEFVRETRTDGFDGGLLPSTPRHLDTSTPSQLPRARRRDVAGQMSMVVLYDLAERARELIAKLVGVGAEALERVAGSLEDLISVCESVLAAPHVAAGAVDGISLSSSGGRS